MAISDQIDRLVEMLSKLYANEYISCRYLEWMDKHSHTIRVKTKESNEIPDSVHRVFQVTKDLNITALFYHVETNYYSWSLQDRAFRLRAPSLEHLCKSIVFENTHCVNKDCSDRLNSRYYCVIVQYCAKLNAQKLGNFIRDLKNQEFSKKRYNMRLASEEVSEKLTGFFKNGVCPFGMLEYIPVIVEGGIMRLKPPVLYLGAGHIDWKISVKSADLVESLNAFVSDLI